MMKPNELLDEAKTLQPQLQKWRRTIHRNPEVGFDLPKTKALVKQALTEMGYAPQDCGRAGVLALAGGKRPGKTILLRGDMDALPIFEESGEVFASEVPGKMHGCGHDMHTAMMLGAAKLLKEHEEEIEGTVKLEFQPAEEIFQGSPDMISNGLLENPKVDAAVMFHVLAGMPLPLGEVLVPGGGITMASCEQYHIVVHGKGGHGSMPENCIDPITAAAHIHIALQEINARELSQNDFGVLTTGRFAAGFQCHPGHRRDVGHHPHHRPRQQDRGVHPAADDGDFRGRGKGVPLHSGGGVLGLLPLHDGGQGPGTGCHDLYDRPAGEGCHGYGPAHGWKTWRRQ